MLTRIEAFHYRCFDHLDINLSRFHVLAGANGSGKSTLLDLPLLLSDLLQRELAAAFLEVPRIAGKPRTHSLSELIHQGKGNYFGFAVEVELPEHLKRQFLEGATAAVARDENRQFSKLRYELRLELFNHQLQVGGEYLWLMANKVAQAGGSWGIGGQRSQPYWKSLVERDAGREAVFREDLNSRGKTEINLPPDELALNNIPRDLRKYAASIGIRDFLGKGSISYEPSWDKLRTASLPGQSSILKSDASNLPWLLLNLKKQDLDLYTAWEDHVKTALPHINSINVVERADDHYAYFKVTYNGGYEVTSSGLSYGTLHIFALTVLPYLLNPPTIICIEELENGIYPKAIESVLQSLSSVYDSQILISTHSPIVLAHVDLEAVIAMRNDLNGAVQAVSGDQHPMLEDWQGKIDLGTLFAAGILE
ncbi:MAG: AAA family ATPase [Leptolyngbya sp. SIOISBB]|nr:AAA family ATPase [Leptolyngbya sp. SIOISBB]